MKFARIIAFIKYYGQFIPFRINFILYLIVLALAYRWTQYNLIDTSSFAGIMMLMAKIALVFSLVIVSISFLSTLFCMLYLYAKKQRPNLIELSIQEDIQEPNKLQIRPKLPFAIKPILGFVKMKLQYDGQKLSDKFIVNGRANKSFIPFLTGLASKNILLLPNIKEYHFSNVLVFFEDMLQFFSFSMTIPYQTTICNLPQNILQDADEVAPKKTDEELIRIEQLKKVEGEYLNYKKFEDADDVRRIVWKIFAKNKELVVRTPETMDPFASHIYMYSSFYNQADYHFSDSFQQEMLNRYKNCIWTIYNALRESKFEVKWIPDQSLAPRGNNADSTRYNIALSHWHHEANLREYFQPKTGSILCIHSYTDRKDLNLLLNECDTHTTIFFVRLSQVFKSHYIVNFLIKIFLKPTTNHLSKLRSQWAFHPLKFQTLSREKELLSLLKKSNLNIELI